jgi:alkaline phosphatase
MALGGSIDVWQPPTTSSRTRGVLALGLTASVAVLAGCTSSGDDAPSAAADVRNVILVNGDGMGAAHREAGRLDQVGVDGRLAMGSMPVTGLQTTDPEDPEAIVTDSAAAASAWATGEKTYNGAISVDVDGEPLATLGTEAAEAGKATGLVTTTRVTDASPAAFFSNARDRGEEGEIARQYLAETGPDVVLGGGAEFWDGDLIAQADSQGYQHVTDADELDTADGDRLLGLFADRSMYPDGSDDPSVEYSSTVPLADMTRKALDVLGRDEDGFFLLVEEEAIDSMSHDNDGNQMLGAMRSLEAAVVVLREYVADHPDTLLVVTGDHDAGGLTIETSDDGDEEPFGIEGSERVFALDWSTDDHTGVPTPVTAEGPRSEQLAGAYPNTHLHGVLREALLG